MTPSAVKMNCKHALINYLRKLIKMLSKDELPQDVWQHILWHFNNIDLRKIATVNKLFYELLNCSLKKRPALSFPDYRNPIQSLKKEDISYYYRHYPLDYGNLAFVLNQFEKQKNHPNLLIYCTGKDTPI